MRAQMIVQCTRESVWRKPFSIIPAKKWNRLFFFEISKQVTALFIFADFFLELKLYCLPLTGIENVCMQCCHKAFATKQSNNR